MKKKFKIFVVFHQNINVDYYDEDLKKHLIFVNVSPNNKNVDKIRQQGFEVINQYDILQFISIGKQYAESEVIYNIYKNQYLIEDLDYVGFIQYDMNTHHLSGRELDNLTDTYPHIAFDEHYINAEYKIGYLMDENQPDRWIGRGKNCFDSIISDYNQFYDTHHSVKELLPKKINLCCAFFLEKHHFNKMMLFISEVIESKKLDKFDTKSKYRMQGGLLERYFGIWLSINSESFYHRPVEHVYDTTNISLQKRGLLSRFIYYIKRKI